MKIIDFNFNSQDSFGLLLKKSASILSLISALNNKSNLDLKMIDDAIKSELLKLETLFNETYASVNSISDNHSHSSDSTNNTVGSAIGSVLGHIVGNEINKNKNSPMGFFMDTSSVKRSTKSNLIDEMAIECDSIINQYYQSTEGKMAVLNFSQKNNIELTKVTKKMIFFAFLSDSNLADKIYKDIISYYIQKYINNDSSNNLTSAQKRTQLLAIMTLKTFSDDEYWHSIVNEYSKAFTDSHDIDDESFDELNLLFNQCLSNRNQILDIINEPIKG